MANSIFRRRLLGLFPLFSTGFPLLPLGAMGWRFVAMPGTIQPVRKVVVGTLDEINPGITVLKEHGIALVRDGDRLSALSLTCTPLGCTIARRGEGFACPCHGSRFRRDGAVANGPATAPLASHDLQILEDRRVVVDLGQTTGPERKAWL